MYLFLSLFLLRCLLCVKAGQCTNLIEPNRRKKNNKIKKKPNPKQSIKRKELTLQRVKIKNLQRIKINKNETRKNSSSPSSSSSSSLSLSSSCWFFSSRFVFAFLWVFIIIIIIFDVPEKKTTKVNDPFQSNENEIFEVEMLLTITMWLRSRLKLEIKAGPVIQRIHDSSWIDDPLHCLKASKVHLKFDFDWFN